MGYFLVTEAENAVPPVPLVRPKTHTPGLRVQERGQRSYKPEVGACLSKKMRGPHVPMCY